MAYYKTPQKIGLNVVVSMNYSISGVNYRSRIRDNY